MIKLLKSVYFNAVVFKSKIHYRLRHILKTFTLKGVKLNISNDEVLSKDVLLSLLQRGYEDKENKIIRDHIDKDDIVLELGTGLGFNSITVAKMNEGKIVSYEGNPYLIPQIKKNQELNQVFFDIRNRILVSRETGGGTLPFTVLENVCASTLRKPPAGFKIKETKQVETESARDVLNEIKPSFLIVDIEGWEEDFFSRPDLLIDSTVKKILVELHPDIIGDDAASGVVQNIMKAGFNLVTESSYESVLFFRKRY